MKIKCLFLSLFIVYFKSAKNNLDKKNKRLYNTNISFGKLRGITWDY